MPIRERLDDVVIAPNVAPVRVVLSGESPETLVEIQQQWNDLVVVASTRGIRATHWVVPPHNRDYGLHRLSWLRTQLGLAPLADAPVLERGEMSHVEIQQQWNALVPQAQAAGIRATVWTRPAPSRVRGMRRLRALQARLLESTGQTAVFDPAIEAIAVDDLGIFDEFTFGVEIECYLPQGLSFYGMSDALRRVGVEAVVESYNHATRPHWKLTTDRSLGDFTRGVELVSPVLRGRAGLESVLTVCRALVAAHCTVRKQCGLHVHVGAEYDMSHLKNLAMMYRKFEPVIDSMLAPERRGAANGFVRPLSFDFRQVERALTIYDLAHAVNNGNRYSKVNFMAWMRQKTVEFRHHQGTIDPMCVEQWLRLVLRITSAAKDTDAVVAPQTLDGLFDIVKAAPIEREYFARAKAGYENRTVRRTVQRRRFSRVVVPSGGLVDVV